MFGSHPSKLDGQMLPCALDFTQNLQHILWNLCIYFLNINGNQNGLANLPLPILLYCLQF